MLHVMVRIVVVMSCIRQSAAISLQALFVANAAGVLMHDITFRHVASFGASLQQLALYGIWHVSFVAVETMLSHLPMLQVSCAELKARGVVPQMLAARMCMCHCPVVR